MLKKSGKFIAGVIAGVMLATLSTAAFAAPVLKNIQAAYSSIKIIVNGKQVETDNEPFSVDGHVYLPIGDVSAALGVNAKWDSTSQSANFSSGGNYADEMKIPYGKDLSAEDGADSVERTGDHPGSPYFSHIDPYNMKSTDTLTILEKFKTQQQTSEWSCGVSSALMVLDYYGKLGDYDEDTLSAFRSDRQGRNGPVGGKTPGATNLQQMIDIFNGVGGFDVYSTFDCVDTVEEVFTFDYIRETLEKGSPIMIGWNDWGGHWQAIIGYDTMGTEIENDDVIIVADPYDTTDHNQDGYGVYGAERFVYNFNFYDFFPEDELNYMTFLVATPVGADS